MRPRTLIRLGVAALLLAASAALPAAGQPAPPDSGQRLLAEGAQALLAGDLETAASRFAAARDLDPGAPVPWLGLAEVHERRGELVEALECARRARQLDSAGLGAALAVGRLQARLGALNEALETLREIRARAPAEPAAYLLAALLLRDAGRRDEAAALLEDGLDRGAAAPEMAEELGLLLVDRGETAKALELARRFLETHPGRPTLHLVLGLALAAENDGREEAIGALSAALRLGVSEPGKVHLELAGLLLGAARAAEAVEELRSAERLLPEAPEVQYRLAAALQAAGDAEGAHKALDRFRRLSGASDEAERGAREIGTALNEAQALAATDRLPEALERLDALLGKAPEEPRALVLKAKVLFSLGRLREALTLIVRARELAPGSLESHYLEGLFALRLGEVERAEAALKRSVTLDAGLAEAHELLAGLYAKQERYAEAAGSFQRTLDLGRDNAPLRLGYAAALESLGRVEESAVQMEAYRRLAAAQ